MTLSSSKLNLFFIDLAIILIEKGHFLDVGASVEYSLSFIVFFGPYLDIPILKILNVPPKFRSIDKLVTSALDTFLL